MSSLSNIEKIKLESLLGMDSGYVLKFGNRSFAEFIKNSIGVNIYDEKYSYESGSKANRLRALWDKEPDELAGKLIAELLECWQTENSIEGIVVTENQQRLYSECQQIAYRLLGKPKSQSLTEDEFLKKDFEEVMLNNLNLDNFLAGIIEQRYTSPQKLDSWLRW